MRRLLAFACLFSGMAVAQDADVQRALMQRQQQSDEFALRLRQSQQRLELAPGDLNQQQTLDSRQLNERQALENLGAQQQQSLGTVGSSPITERQAADRARQMELQKPYELRLPPPMVRSPVTPRPKERAPYFPDTTR